MNNYCVYKHTSPTGKVYIGITSLKPEYRWRNGVGYQNNKHFYNAINKYNWDSFEHEIIADNLSKLDAERLEIELIKKHQSDKRQYGYNISPGGALMSKETRNKLSGTMKGVLKDRWEDPEFRKKIIDAKSNPENKHKHSESMKKRWMDHKYKQRHSDSMTDREYKIKRSNISKSYWEDPVSKQKQSETMKAYWSKPEAKLNMSNRSNALWSTAEYRNKICKKVRCIETGIIYNSMSEAEAATGANISSISCCCRDVPTYHTAGGYHWEFAV